MPSAVDPRTGAVLWNTTIPVPPRIDGKTELYLYAFEFEDPVVVAEVIYQEDFDDAVYLVVMDQDTGVILWIWEDFGFGDVFPISRADASVNHLCTTQSSANTVMGRDARTGAVKFNVTFADAQQVYAFPNPNTASVLLRFETGQATDVLRKFNALTNQVTVEYAIPASADVHVAANGEFYVWDDGAYFARIATGETLVNTTAPNTPSSYCNNMFYTITVPSEDTREFTAYSALTGGQVWNAVRVVPAGAVWGVIFSKFGLALWVVTSDGLTSTQLTVQYVGTVAGTFPNDFAYSWPHGNMIVEHVSGEAFVSNRYRNGIDVKCNLDQLTLVAATLTSLVGEKLSSTSRFLVTQPLRAFSSIAR
jgi:outer membrane protein assembly factor BamB